jgi:hypothetical protein
LRFLFVFLERAWRRSPLDFVLGAVALAAAAYAVIAPFTASRYPAMTDFPFHTAGAATLRHYWDPSYHFQDQFNLRPLAVPYLSLYALGAVLMLFLPAVTAAKVAGAVMVALVPAGLAVLFHGFRKSPLLGLLGFGVAWCSLTHWGFLNAMGALGLFAAAIGFTARLVDRPSRGASIALALTLVALYFTHIFRFPFALAAVIGTAVVMYPATRRLRPIALPMLPALALLAVWLRIRPPSLASGLGPLSFHVDRFRELFGAVSGSFRDHSDRIMAGVFYGVVGLVALVSWGLARHRPRMLSRRALAWSAGALVVPASCALVFGILFFILPMWIGAWWYVYPRETVSLAFLLLALAPDLPRSPALRAPLTLALVLAVLGVGRNVATNYAVFDASTRDFTAIIEQIPKAPKLLYLVFDHEGSTRIASPYMHLPAYVQAEKGGWLSFHFAVFGASPLEYRAPSEKGAVVPPRMPFRFEWEPGTFAAAKHAPFFDWFLVRRVDNPDALFSADRAIERVDHVGTWWLYRRKTSPWPRPR